MLANYTRPVMCIYAYFSRKYLFSAYFSRFAPIFLAPQVGFEPTTYRLTADCSTAELLRNIPNRNMRYLVRLLA